MKLSKVIAAVATIAIASEVTRRIVSEIDNRRMDAELAAIKERAEKPAINAITRPMDYVAESRIDIRKLVAEVERYQKYIETLKHVYWSGTDYELEQMIIRGVEDE